MGSQDTCSSPTEHPQDRTFGIKFNEYPTPFLVSKMPYTPELFNRYNERVMESSSAVSRHIMYLLRPDDGYPKGSDEKLKQLYNMWRADCRAMDAACEEHSHLRARHAMIEMPPDDEEHFLCRRMAAVIIERNISGEHVAGSYYLPDLVEQMKSSTCYTHPYTCACHYHLGDAGGWTFENYDLICTLSASYEEKEKETERQASLAESAGGGGPLSYQPAMGGGRPAMGGGRPVLVACAGWRDCTCGGCSGGGPPSEAQRRAHSEHVAARSADKAIAAAKAMPGGSTDDGFAKNLFQTVQGVKFDEKCPHGLPFYACMSCSH